MLPCEKTMMDSKRNVENEYPTILMSVVIAAVLLIWRIGRIFLLAVLDTRTKKEDDPIGRSNQDLTIDNTERTSSELSSKNDMVVKKPNSETTNSWRCACEGGFLPPGMLKNNFSGVEATFYAGTGKCYHKLR